MAMRVILKVLSGPSAGQTVLLSAGQELRVGRTEWADFVLANDGKMSSVHFAIETNHQGSRIKDLKSTNGTLVNGEKTGSAVLHDGDRIEAGETAFLVTIEGGPTRAKPPEAGGAEVHRNAEPEDSAPAAPAKLPYERRQCRSELMLLEGSVPEGHPSTVALWIGKRLPLYLVIHLAKIEQSRPEKMENPEYLMDWLPDGPKEENSPVLLAASALPKPQPLLEEAWGKDAVICLYSNTDAATLIGLLRRAPGSFLRPSLLRPHLTQAGPAYSANLMEGLEAVVVEGEDPETWCLVAREEFQKAFDEMGFCEQKTGNEPPKQPDWER